MIKIFPLEQVNLNNKDINFYLNLFSEFKENIQLNDIIGDYIFFKSGKDAIRAIIEKLNLNKDDEIYIDTTLNNSYVTTCVSATLFNYSKISRVITEKTKVIFVIHTFSHPNPRIYELRDYCDEKGIILIEDCISSFDSFDKLGNRMGSFGDYSIYSIPKIFPFEYGGLLTTSKPSSLKGIEDNVLKETINTWEKFLPHLKYLKQERYRVLEDTFPNKLYEDDRNITPFMFGYKSYNNHNSLKEIEYGRTHVKNEVHIPINAFAEKKEYLSLLKGVK